MKIFYSLEEAKGIPNPVVTTGTFDGVHVGHQVIIRRLNKLAKDINGESVLITFHPHPRRVLYPDTKGKDLMLICSQKEKIELLEDTGLDNLIILNFTKEFSKTTSHSFVEDMLIGMLRAKMIVVGFNHHFGHNREGDYEYLYKLGRNHGFEVEEIPEQDIQNESVSSTKIRKALLEGNIRRANAYLDHYYFANGVLRYNSSRSKLMNLELYSFKLDENVKLIPPDGVYAVNIKTKTGYSRAMLRIEGHEIINNEFASGLTIEIHPFEENISEQEVGIYFHKKIRDKCNNQDTEYLKKQWLKDKAEIEELIY